MTKNEDGLLTRLRPLHRAAISAVFAWLAWLLLPHTLLFTSRLVISWGVFSLVYLVLCYIIIASMNAADTKRKAAEEDGSRWFVMTLIIISALASFMGVLSLITGNGLQYSSSFTAIISVSVITLSWFLVHTTFLFHYAYMYYKDDHAGGLLFPGDEQPDYMDFAYFSFCMGSTFQVSDVSITDKGIRRLALLHSLLAFALNTFVVALTINLIAGLTK